MSTPAARQPPFYCPACGKKHRADLSALQGRAGAVAKVTCARCGIEMALRLGDDGLPKCEGAEPLGGTMSQPDVKTPGLLVPVAAAAIVAAIVAFAVSSVAGGTTPAPAEDPRVAALEQQVQALAERLDTAQAERDALEQTLEEQLAALGSRVDRAEGTVGSMGETVSGLETRTAKLSTAFLEIQTEHEGLGGRIEANRVTTRQLDKRLKELEAR